jgi:hypothetical protein
MKIRDGGVTKSSGNMVGFPVPPAPVGLDAGDRVIPAVEAFRFHEPDAMPVLSLFHGNGHRVQGTRKGRTSGRWFLI